MEFEQEITSLIRADYAKIAQIYPKGTSMLFIKPYASGTVINVSEKMSQKYSKSYHYFLALVSPIAQNLMKEYFG